VRVRHDRTVHEILPGGVGLWSGFLDRLSAGEAVTTAAALEAAGTQVIWLQEFSGVDPFVRAALYLQGTERLVVALGVATIHARDPEAMVAVASTLHEAFPGRFLLGLGASHRHLAEARGGEYTKPLTALHDYLAAMEAATGRRELPPRFLGALGPRMVELAGTATAGLHSYFAPVAHTADARARVGVDPWIAPTVMVVSGQSGSDWRDHARPYFGLCLGMPNYRRNLRRFGFTESDLETTSDELVEALAVPDDPAAIRERIAAHVETGADHVQIQLVPPPPAAAVLARVAEGLCG
jgi:probable F420-dependent oxidoreductase